MLLATARARPSRSGVDERIRPARALIAADPGAPRTERSLAEGLPLSPSRFAPLFIERLGLSPMTALREARLRHAARLFDAGPGIPGARTELTDFSSSPRGSQENESEEVSCSCSATCAKVSPSARGPLPLLWRAPASLERHPLQKSLVGWASGMPDILPWILPACCGPGVPQLVCTNNFRVGVGGTWT